MVETRTGGIHFDCEIAESWLTDRSLPKMVWREADEATLEKQSCQRNRKEIGDSLGDELPAMAART